MIVEVAEFGNPAELFGSKTVVTTEMNQTTMPIQHSVEPQRRITQKCYKLSIVRIDETILHKFCLIAVFLRLIYVKFDTFMKL